MKSFIQLGEQFHVQLLSLILIRLVMIVTTCQPEVSTSALILYKRIITFPCLPEVSVYYTLGNLGKFKNPTLWNCFSPSLSIHTFVQIQHFFIFYFVENL